MVHSHGAIHSARNGTHTTLHTDHFIVATHVVHSQWCMRELLCSFALLRSGMGPHLSAATPGPFSLFRVAIVLDLEVDVEVGAQNLDQLGQWNRIEWRERRERRGINRDGHNRPSPVRACHLYCLHSQWWYTHSLSLFLRTHAATFQWLPRVLLGSFALLRCEVGATLTAVSAATPAPFTISGSACARSRGRCRSRSPEC